MQCLKDSAPKISLKAIQAAVDKVSTTGSRTMELPGFLDLMSHVDSRLHEQSAKTHSLSDALAHLEVSVHAAHMRDFAVHGFKPGQV